MNNHGQTYRILIIPRRNGSKILSFQISNILVACLFGGILFVLIVSGFLMYKSVQVAKKLHYYSALQNDNERIKKENINFRLINQKFAHIDSIAAYLELLTNVSKPLIDKNVEEKEPFINKGIEGKAENKFETERNLIPSVLPVDGWITQRFTKDTSQEGLAHPGIDIAASSGMIIKATAPGTVIAVLQDVDYGIMIVIQHEEGFVTRYGHCEKALVAINDKVDRGQTIALVGNTGHSSAPHLHYEVIKNGKNVDPQQYIAPEKKPLNRGVQNG
jgi:murein DD-endopeptidase MepM/ murein hydrolase activator NlpD